jgi:hypothetical protein
MGIKRFKSAKLPLTAVASFGFNLFGICRLKQLLTVPGVVFLNAALITFCKIFSGAGKGLLMIKMEYIDTEQH